MANKINPNKELVKNALANATEALTLAEISELAGSKIATGVTNAMVKEGTLVKVGTKKVAKTVFVEVTTYALAGSEAASISEAE